MFNDDLPPDHALWIFCSWINNQLNLLYLKFCNIDFFSYFVFFYFWFSYPYFTNVWLYDALHCFVAVIQLFLYCRICCNHEHVNVWTHEWLIIIIWLCCGEIFMGLFIVLLEGKEGNSASIAWKLFYMWLHFYCPSNT